jgi:hypothetical protein
VSCMFVSYVYYSLVLLHIQYSTASSMKIVFDGLDMYFFNFILISDIAVAYRNACFWVEYREMHSIHDGEDRDASS